MLKTKRKFYVNCGELQMIVTAKCSLYACYLALSRCTGSIELGPNYFYVDERGFRSQGDVTNDGARHWHRVADVMDYCENVLGWEGE